MLRRCNEPADAGNVGLRLSSAVAARYQRGMSEMVAREAGEADAGEDAGAHPLFRSAPRSVEFNTEIGKFEGVQEATADIAGGAYTLEAMRHLVTKGLENGAPSVMTAMAKYHATEIMRRVINHSMDVVAGRAIQLGPRNFLAFPYQSIPVAITVEGANILTRSLMIFGQGAVRCHPYLFREMEAMQADDLETFDQLFIRHLGHVFSNLTRTLVYGVTRGRFSEAPANADNFSTRWYQRINILSASLAVTLKVTWTLAPPPPATPSRPSLPRASGRMASGPASPARPMPLPLPSGK